MEYLLMRCINLQILVDLVSYLLNMFCEDQSSGFWYLYLLQIVSCHLEQYMALH